MLRTSSARLQLCATDAKNGLTAEFACKISPSKTALEASKRYPLHLVGTVIEIPMALNNEGPGVAQNVTTYCVVDHGEVRNAETSLGAVNPGPFVLTQQIALTEPHTEIQADRGSPLERRRRPRNTQPHVLNEYSRSANRH